MTQGIDCLIKRYLRGPVSFGSLQFSKLSYIHPDYIALSGKVTSVDLIKHTVTMKVNINNTESEKTFVFDNDTNVVEGNTLKTVNDIKSGDIIVISIQKAWQRYLCQDHHS